MTKLKKIVSSPIFSIAAVVLAAGLLVFSSIRGARAALNIESDDYRAHVELYDTGVTLNENGKRVAWRDYVGESSTWDEGSLALCADMLDTNKNGKADEGDEKLKLGKAYPEVLTVTNSGAINEFVRVTITKYWLDSKGNKANDLDPKYIDLHLTPGTAWILDASSTTTERTVLYYNQLLTVGSTTPALSDTLTLSDSLATIVSQEETKEKKADGYTYTTIKTTYLYDGYQFVIEAEVDAVQEHNAAQAVKSAWGRNVTVSGTTLSLQ